MSTHRLSFLQKKLRSFVRRFLTGFVNASDSFVVQHIPESFCRSKIQLSKLRKIWNYRNKKNNNVDMVRLHFLICSVEELLDSDVPGSFAEVGVYKGNSAKLFHELAPKRKLYLFDTFSGFDARDLKIDPKKSANPNAFLDTSLDGVKAFVNGSENVYFCPGYFPSTISYVPKDEQFALVHLDADLYQPIKAGLEYFYPRLAPGALMIIHDYFSGAWPGVKQAVDEFLKDKPHALIRIPDKSGTVVFRKCLR